MSAIFLLAVTNIVFNIGALVGISVWASSNDIYTSTDSYGFYWFVTIVSNVIGVLGYIYHVTPYLKEYVTSENKTYVGYFMLVLTVLNSVFWLSAASSTSVVLKNCLVLKRTFDRYTLFSFFDDSNLTCNGQIVSVVFGFLELLLWCTILIVFIKKIVINYNNESTDIHELDFTSGHQEEVTSRLQVELESIEEHENIDEQFTTIETVNEQPEHETAEFQQAEPEQAEAEPEQAEAEQPEQAEAEQPEQPEQAEPEQPEQAEPEQAEPEQAEAEPKAETETETETEPEPEQAEPEPKAKAETEENQIENKKQNRYSFLFSKIYNSAEKL
jgi:flagellar biosynthesis GTPase FlhF